MLESVYETQEFFLVTVDRVCILPEMEWVGNVNRGLRLVFEYVGLC